MKPLLKIKRRLEDIDRALERQRTATTKQLPELLRLRRECLLEIRDLETNYWGHP